MVVWPSEADVTVAAYRDVGYGEDTPDADVELSATVPGMRVAPDDLVSSDIALLGIRQINMMREMDGRRHLLYGP